MNNPPLILASQSPRRRILLKQIGLRFRVVPSNAPEIFRNTQSPAENAERVALEKAVSIAEQRRLGLVIGADTIVVIKGKILGKPASARDAKCMLRTLSGKTHTVLTGFALVDASSKKRITGVETTRVTFRRLSANEIDAYVASGSPMDKAGAYGIQDDYGAVFVEKVAGCFYNVVGFPLSRFFIEYQRFLAGLNHQRKR